MTVERDGPHRGARRWEAHGERGFGEAIHRIHGVARQPRGREPGQELLAELHRDRLRTVEDEPDARAVQPFDRPLTEDLEIVLVAKVGRAEDGGANTARERQPEERPADEELRRHEVRVHAAVEHDEMEADQAHVMGERHPGKTDVLRTEARRGDRAPRGGNDVAVRQNHALGLAGGAGGELDEGGIVRPRPMRLTCTRNVIQVIDQEGTRAQALEGLRLAGLRREGADALERAALCVDEGRAELAGDAQQLVAVLVADAERDGHRDDAAEHGSPERVYELLVAREEEDQLVAAARTEALQVMENAERTLVELLETGIARVVLALEISDPARVAAVDLDELGQSGRVRHQRRSSLMCKG